MNLDLEPYSAQAARWPGSGRHVLAQFDAETVVVYQAYRPEVGRAAAIGGRFGPGFKRDRMTWVKPNFLWMMYRSGWGTKPDQEVTLALRLRRSGFDAMLARAIHSSFVAEAYASPEQWKAAVARSNVRLQWDPDHHPSGAPLDRRAVQLGLRGDALARYADEWIVGIEDVSDFVAVQRDHVGKRDYGALVTPREDVYPVADPAVASRLGVSRAA